MAIGNSLVTKKSFLKKQKKKKQFAVFVWHTAIIIMHGSIVFILIILKIGESYKPLKKKKKNLQHQMKVIFWKKEPFFCV